MDNLSFSYKNRVDVALRRTLLKEALGVQLYDDFFEFLTKLQEAGSKTLLVFMPRKAYALWEAFKPIIEAEYPDFAPEWRVTNANILLYAIIRYRRHSGGEFPERIVFVDDTTVYGYALRRAIERVKVCGISLPEDTVISTHVFVANNTPQVENLLNDKSCPAIGGWRPKYMSESDLRTYAPLFLRAVHTAGISYSTNMAAFEWDDEVIAYPRLLEFAKTSFPAKDITDLRGEDYKDGFEIIPKEGYIDNAFCITDVISESLNERLSNNEVLFSSLRFFHNAKTKKTLMVSNVSLQPSSGSKDELTTAFSEYMSWKMKGLFWSDDFCDVDNKWYTESELYKQANINEAYAQSSFMCFEFLRGLFKTRDFEKYVTPVNADMFELNVINGLLEKYKNSLGEEIAQEKFKAWLKAGTEDINVCVSPRDKSFAGWFDNRLKQLALETKYKFACIGDVMTDLMHDVLVHSRRDNETKSPMNSIRTDIISFDHIAGLVGAVYRKHTLITDDLRRATYTALLQLCDMGDCVLRPTVVEAENAKGFSVGTVALTGELSAISSWHGLPYMQVLAVISEAFRKSGKAISVESKKEMCAALSDVISKRLASEEGDRQNEATRSRILRRLKYTMPLAFGYELSENDDWTAVNIEYPIYPVACMYQRFEYLYFDELTTCVLGYLFNDFRKKKMSKSANGSGLLAYIEKNM